MTRFVSWLNGLFDAYVIDGMVNAVANLTYWVGNRFRRLQTGNINGYLYVAQQGTSGNWTVLFPNPQINGGLNAVKRFQEYEVPSGDWFQFDGAAGTEHVFVFLSREPLAKLPGFDRPVRSFESGSPTMIAELRTSI